MSSKSDVTPYVAAQIATAILREDGILGPDEEIAPQSMYGNKTIKRYGEARRDGGDGIMFDGDSFYEWLSAQREGRESGRRARVNLPKLLAEYGNGADEEAAEDEAVDETTAQLEASLAERGVEVPGDDDEGDKPEDVVTVPATDEVDEAEEAE